MNTDGVGFQMAPSFHSPSTLETSYTLTSLRGQERKE